METKNFELDDVLRRVRLTGVMFKARGIGGIYWAPQLTDHYGCYVRVGFDPDAINKDALNSVLIFCAETGKFICEAWLLGQEDSRYGIDDLRRERRYIRSYAKLRCG
jgi:hypothetical protein